MDHMGTYLHNWEVIAITSIYGTVERAVACYTMVVKIPSKYQNVVYFPSNFVANPIFDHFM